MPQWQKPENALRRANELLEVSKKQDALDTLHDVIKARKHRQWTKIHELIMTKHLELCVELRKPHLAKDGLFQYRNMCQQVNVKSLEDVIVGFLDLAEKKADQAREESHGLVEDIEDLDQAESPEKLLLSAVSGEGAQDRADRAVLSPWLRFLWESYRQCLELLRNNVQVEMLYHRVAKQGFQFCLKYQRKAEFRKLCDNLRTHLNQIQKSQHAHYALKLTNAETLAMHQDTRLIQLDVAIQMELWQEAFKSAEDVHQLMQLSKRQAKASTLASYYEKLALIFWKAGNILYHAAALMKLLQLTKELKKTVSPDEFTHLATRSLLATLSIQWTGVCSDLSRHLEMEEAQAENQRRLASLIMMPSSPTRQSLMKDVIRLNVNNMALPAAQQLYLWLEMKFDPLNLASEIHKQLNVFKDLGKAEYVQYVESLKQVTALKVLKQVSQVYQTTTFKFLTKVIQFFDISQIERLLVAAGKKAQMQVRLHHRTESVEFGVTDGLSFGGEEEEASSYLAAAQLNVPVVQSMPNEQIRQHLQQMYAALQEAVDSVDLDAKKHILEQLRSQITFYNYHAADQHKRTLERKKRIEQYKEIAEKVREEQEELQKEQERISNEQKMREAEQRLEQERADRMERQKREQEENLRRRMAEDRLARMKDPKLKQFMEDMDEGEIQNMDPDALLQRQISHLEEEKRKQIASLKQQEKKWDYLVRAMHVEEIPLREQEYTGWAVDDKTMWDEYETNRIKKANDDHHFMIDSYNRLQRMEQDAEEVVASIRQARASDFKQRLVDWEKRLKETREKRLKERKEERKAKRREEWLAQKKEEEKRKREEEEKQRREQEASKRSEERGGRFQGRRGFDHDNKDANAEPSGADAEKWVRLPAQPTGPSDEGRGGGRRIVRTDGPRSMGADGSKPAPWSGSGMRREEEGERDWSVRQGPLEGGFRRQQQQGEAEPDRQQRPPPAEPDWGKRQGPIEGPPASVPPERAPPPPQRYGDDRPPPPQQPRYGEERRRGWGQTDERRGPEGFGERKPSYEDRRAPVDEQRPPPSSTDDRQTYAENREFRRRYENEDGGMQRGGYRDRGSRYDGGNEPDWNARQNQPAEGRGGYNQGYRRQGPPDGTPSERQRDYGEGEREQREPDWGRRQGPIEGPPSNAPPERQPQPPPQRYGDERPPPSRYSDERPRRWVPPGERRGGPDDRRPPPQHDDRRGGPDDRRGGPDDRRPPYDDRRPDRRPPDDRQTYAENPEFRRRYENEEGGMSRRGGYRGDRGGGSRYDGGNEPDWNARQQNPAEDRGGYNQGYRRPMRSDGPPPSERQQRDYGEREPDWNKRVGTVDAPPPHDDRSHGQRYDNREQQYPPDEEGWERVPSKHKR